MTKNRFVDIVKNHDDIEMHCGDFNFTIMTCYDDYFLVKDSKFKDIDEILAKFMIGDKTLEEALNQVELHTCS